MKNGRARVLTYLALIIPALLLLSGCGDDDSPTGPAGDPYAPNSIEALFSRAFEYAYNSEDSARYESILDERYEFIGLPRDPENPYIFETWNKSDELGVAGRMFAGWTSPDGIKVTSISINIDLLDTSETTENFTDQPIDETWYEAETDVDLLVVTEDPSASDGSGIVNRVAYSGQDFVVRPDPDDDDLWVIRRQTDREATAKQGTEDLSWGEIKSIFYIDEAASIRTTPEGLVTTAFETAYAGRDGAAYERLLDDNYEFENLPADPDDPLYVEIWDHDEELRIAGRMFTGWSNGDGVRVLDINLNIVFLGQSISTALYDDQPVGETWYKAITEVNLLVVTQDPSASDGSGIINRVVYSNQDFVVRPDPADTTLWVIRKQFDRNPITKTSTGETNWGEVKDLFRAPRDRAGEAGTENASWGEVKSLFR